MTGNQAKQILERLVAALTLTTRQLTTWEQMLLKECEELPEEKELPCKLVPYDKVADLGFAKFNGCNHLLVELPNETFTISCKTSDGKKITFSFLLYPNKESPQCVDIQYHSSGVFKQNGDSKCPAQHVICWTTGHSLFNSTYKDEELHTLTTLILDKKP